MEVELKNIIEKIKKEGIETGEKEAEKILQHAKEEEKNIIESANKRKNEILEKARTDADKLRKIAEEEIKQAARDAKLSLKEDVVKLFDNIIKKEVASVFTPETVKELIVKLIEKMMSGKDTGLEVLLSRHDKEVFEKYLSGIFKKEIEKENIVFKVSPNIKHGFLVGVKGSNSYYDVTDEAVAEMFFEYLNPKITEILNPSVMVKK